MALNTSDNVSPVAGLIEEGRVSATQWLVLVTALVLNMLDGFDVTAMAFVAHSVGQELGIPASQLGVVFSVALAGMMIGAMFLAPYSDVVGRRTMVLLSVIAIGLSMLAAGLSSTLWQLIVLRLITGLGVGGLLASLATITAEYTPYRYKSLAVVVVTAGYPLGATLGGFIAAPLLAEYGWRSIFLAGGIATLLMFVVVYLWVPESMQFLIRRRPKHALARLNRILARFGRPPATALPEEGAGDEGTRANVFSLLTPARRAKTLQLWSTFFFCFISLYFLMSWIPKLVVNAGLSESYGVYASAAFNGGAVLGILTLGWLASRFSLSRLIGGFLLLTGTCMLVFALAEGALPLLPMLLVIGFLLQGGFTGLYAVAAKIYPTEVRSTGVGWAIGLGRFGAVVGPYAGGLLIAAGFSMEANFIVYAVPTLLAGLLAWRLSVD